MQHKHIIVAGSACCSHAMPEWVKHVIGSGRVTGSCSLTCSAVVAIIMLPNKKLPSPAVCSQCSVHGCYVPSSNWVAACVCTPPPQMHVWLAYVLLLLTYHTPCCVNRSGRSSGPVPLIPVPSCVKIPFPTGLIGRIQDSRPDIAPLHSVPSTHMSTRMHMGDAVVRECTATCWPSGLLPPPAHCAPCPASP